MTVLNPMQIQAFAPWPGPKKKSWRPRGTPRNPRPPLRHIPEGMHPGGRKPNLCYFFGTFRAVCSSMALSALSFISFKTRRALVDLIFSRILLVLLCHATFPSL